MERKGKNYRVSVVPARPAKVEVIEPARPAEVEIVIGEKTLRLTPDEAMVLVGQLEAIAQAAELLKPSEPSV